MFEKLKVEFVKIEIETHREENKNNAVIKSEISTTTNKSPI